MDFQLDTPTSELSVEQKPDETLEIDDPNANSAVNQNNEDAGGSMKAYSDFCLVCNSPCVVALPVHTKSPYKYKQSPMDISQDIRKAFYRAFDLGVDPSEVFSGGRSSAIKGDVPTVPDLPLCTYCTFKCGQIKNIQSQLLVLEREYQRLREEIAFSIVDVVAGSTGSLLDFGKHSRTQLLDRLRAFEVETLQQFVFDRWCEASYSDFSPMASPKDKPSTSPSKLYRSVDTESYSKGSGVGLREDGSYIDDQSAYESYDELPGTSATAGSNMIYKSTSRQRKFQGIETSDDALAVDEQDDFCQIEGEGNGSSAIPFSLGLTNYTVKATGQQDGITEENNRTPGNEHEEGFMDDDADEYGSKKGRRKSEFSDQSLDLCINSEGLYGCMYCDKTFQHKYPFRDHLKTHTVFTGEGPKCPICSKIFPKPNNLVLHLRTHTGEKPYSCSVCHKGFADRSNLKVHMRVHTGERPYQCEYCDLAFVNSSRLVVHRRQHTGEKPFTCDICQQNFTTTNQLANHRKTHSDTKAKLQRPFNCTECRKGFTNNTSLTAHLGLYHGI